MRGERLRLGVAPQVAHLLQLERDARDAREGNAEHVRDLGLVESVRPLGEQFHDADSPRKAGNGEGVVIFCHGASIPKLPPCVRAEIVIT